MAVDGKILVEIERMFKLVGTLQDHFSEISKHMMTLTTELNSSAECKEDLNEKEPTAESEMITKEKETKQEKEKAKLQNTNQNLTSVEYKQGDYWIEPTTNLRKMLKTKVEALETYVGIQESKTKKYNGGLHIDFDSDYDLQGDYWIESTTNLRKMLKTKVEALEVYGMQEFKIKKYNWGLHIDFDFDCDLKDPCLVEIPQQLYLRDYGWTVIELFRDLMTDTKDYQQDRRRGTARDWRASDVRNPG